MRYKRVNGQLTDTAKVSETKKNVAKLLTAINKSK
jgi:ribosomal protein L29